MIPTTSSTPFTRWSKSMSDDANRAIRALIAANPKRAISYRDFTRWALYDRVHGYYRKKRQRVGVKAGTDFYTNLAFRSVFAPLVIAAITDSLPDSPSNYCFVEIAAEPEGGLIREGNPHPFADVVQIHLDDPVQIPPKAVVFANEWLDAQPFHRFRFADGDWREVGVSATADDTLEECLLGGQSDALAGIRESLPFPHPEGYTLDLSLDAENILAELLASPWRGRFVTVDYGHAFEYLIHEIPQGSGRAYYRHRQVSDLLARPGEQDLTSSVCWTRIQKTLTDWGFVNLFLYRQEEFFMKRASSAVAKIVESGPVGYTPERAGLLGLLHPGQMGARFQVLVADRVNDDVDRR